MSDKSGEKAMFFYVGTYDTDEAAEQDFEDIRALHEQHAIRSYDAAIITKDRDGKVHVKKTEKPTQHGAWMGFAAGAAVALAAPVALPGVVAAGGAGIGAWLGHLAHGTSRADAKELGEKLRARDTALVVVGVDEDADRIASAATRSLDHTLKRIRADWATAEAEAMEALREQTERRGADEAPQPTAS